MGEKVPHIFDPTSIPNVMSVVNSTWKTQDLVLSQRGLSPSGLIPEETGKISSESVAVPRSNMMVRVAMGLLGMWDWCFGAISMIVILAFLATVPILNLMSLGTCLKLAGELLEPANSRKALSGFVKPQESAALPWEHG